MTYTVNIIESSYLPATKSAQQVELIALTQDCQVAKTQIVNIYIYIYIYIYRLLLCLWSGIGMQ